jgi:tetratricopeptide (TPR) repeat protein
MKKIIYFTLIIFILASCDDKLDITPKGMTVLNKVSDLELLLNNNMAPGGMNNIINLSMVCNECYPDENVNLVMQKENSIKYAYLTYDEKIDRAALTVEDTNYSTAYKMINYMNTILDKIEASDGDESAKKEIAAEAHIIRAYEHFLLVNMYAKQYDDATAKDLGGIPYVTDTNVASTKKKLSLYDVYQNILKDCADEYINLLPDQSKVVIRGNKAWGNAVRAKVLMQMKHYSEALPYALAALKYNDKIEDRTPVIQSKNWELDQTAPTNILLMTNGFGMPFKEIISLETIANFEKGDIIKNYAKYYGITPAWNQKSGESGSGVTGALMFRCFNQTWNTWGVTSDRMYYTAAECYIRTGKYQEGLDLINKVRKYRIDPQSYADFTATSEEAAMKLLQPAKWIECIATYENFFDCKRWNTEDKYKKTITRTMPVGDKTYTYSIAPDSKLWVFPFPTNATRYNSTLTQNY